MKNLFLIPTISFFAYLASCASNNDNTDLVTDPDAVTVTEEIVVPSYLGNGPQWGGYDVVPQWTGNETLSDSDWNKVFTRLDFMRPKFVRIMISAGWSYYVDGVYDPVKSEPMLQKMLDYCEKNSISVQFGEWGHQEVDGSIDQDWLSDCAKFLNYLVNEKGYSCVKFFTMTNEPNGDWSTVNGEYSLWKSLVQQFYAKIDDYGLTNKVQIMGPDVAVWTGDDMAWLSNSMAELSDEIGSYDIHTYPDETAVRTTSYSNLLDIYKASSDKSKMIVLGELGLSYDPSGELGKENSRRIAADKYASSDSQMFVYDAFYGIDVADATIQTMNAGYAGVIFWALDDAMYNVDGSNSTELKRWGFWNILGEEKFENPEDENIRPWFYPISLMCRYFPTGSTIYGITMPQEVRSGLRVTAGEFNGKHTIAIVNNGTKTHTFNLKSSKLGLVTGLKEYRYITHEGADFTGNVDENGFPEALATNESINFTDGEELTIEPKTFVLFTNMD
ncbi:MAG: cellulase family glycosylhydrolase [Rikenellaceae bacterium]